MIVKSNWRIFDVPKMSKIWKNWKMSLSGGSLHELMDFRRSRMVEKWKDQLKSVQNGVKFVQYQPKTPPKSMKMGPWTLFGTKSRPSWLYEGSNHSVSSIFSDFLAENGRQGSILRVILGLKMHPKSMQKSKRKSVLENVEKWCKNDPKMVPTWSKIDAKIKVVGKKAECRKCYKT